VPTTATTTATRRLPLIVTADPVLLDDLLRLAAAGSAEVHVAHDPVAARVAWTAAPFVLLGADQVEPLARAGLPPRGAVILVLRPDQAEPPWRFADALRVEQVVVMPQAEAWLVDRFADHAMGSPTRGRVIAVLGGRGGAGASVLAAALAVTGRRRDLDTLLIDADPFGGGVDLVLGWEQMQGLRWPDLVDASGRMDPPALMSALPGRGNLSVLSFTQSELDGVPTEALASALDAGRRGRDLVVLDLPRRFDEPSLLALTTADRVYLVVPAELRACAAARRVAGVAGHYCAAISVIVRGSAPLGLAPSEIARTLDLPLGGELRSESRLDQDLDSGRPPAANGRGPLAELCRELLRDVAPRRHRAVAR
jgi:secretion/DNA translocation related CpaE-like protein